ncbi:MAG: RimK/LysX family protein [Pseudomonadota bacterium]|nr:RimK/LysX family protein [Pseudomonadota bacterium]
MKYCLNNLSKPESMYLLKSSLLVFVLAPSWIFAKVTTLGATEGVYVSSGATEDAYCARIDTGALSTSIHATDIKVYQKNQRNWVSFVIKGCFNGRCYKQKMKKPLLRYQTVKQAAGSVRRPVVILNIKIRDVIDGPYAVTLADRSKLEYPVLIGRNVLDTKKAKIKVNVNINRNCLVEYGYGFVHKKG